MADKKCFSPSTLCLGVVTAASAEYVLCNGMQTAARGAVLCGFLQAAAAAFTAQLLAPTLIKNTAAARLASALLAVWFAAELLQLVFQAQSLCVLQFSSPAVLGAVPFLAWFGWKHTAGELNYTARVLWWLVLLAALVCVLGLGGQLKWQRLFESGSSAPNLWSGAPAVLYAEYFAFPLLCDKEAGTQCRAVLLPFGGYAVCAGFALLHGLLFGAAGSGYSGMELMRALAVGAFSRLDSLLLFVWLLTALFRVCFLCSAVHILLQKLTRQPCAREGIC